MAVVAYAWTGGGADTTAGKITGAAAAEYVLRTGGATASAGRGSAG